MIFITGDCHQNFQKFNMKSFPLQKQLTKDDYVIICGDFGGIWNVGWENKQERHDMDWLEEKSFTTLFVDGNHENFDRLYGYPVEEWHGGKVHKIRPSVLHLMRGQIYEIDGATFFTFGGARSHDISGGILDPEDPNFRKKKRQLEREWQPFRIRHLSWWEQELACEEERAEGVRNLEKVNYQVDYIISHCTATKVQELVSAEKGERYEPDGQTDFFDFIREKTQYQKWYFGHYHDNLAITDKDILLYGDIVELGEVPKKNNLGRPRFLKGDLVEFTKGEPEKFPEILEGRISIIDAYGTFEQREEPSYDILVIPPDGTKCLYKHIRESWVKLK